MFDVRFLKGLTPEYKHPAVAHFPDGDDVKFTAVFRRPDTAVRDAVNVLLLEVTQKSLTLRKQLLDGEMDAIAYAEQSRANNQRLVDELGKHLIRCEGLVDGNGSAFAWSDEVFQMMIRSNEYGAALGMALREMAQGKRVEEDEAKNSMKSATGSTGATVVELPRPA